MESAFVLMVLFVLVLGMFDFGIAAFRRNLLCEGAKRIARMAVLHGENSSQPFGPESIDTQADENQAILATLAPILKTMRADEIRVQVVWQDTSNVTNSLVQVEVEYPNGMLMSRWWGIDLISLHGHAAGRIE
ncbi:MAG: TadE/TadG family type IV pilus assembly protein [Pirellulaceae bacterium]